MEDAKVVSLARLLRGSGQRRGEREDCSAEERTALHRRFGGEGRGGRGERVGSGTSGAVLLWTQPFRLLRDALMAASPADAWDSAKVGLCGDEVKRRQI